MKKFSTCLPQKGGILLGSIILLFNWQVYGQYHETIRSGRPGQSIGPFTVGKGVFQIQSGMDNSFLSDSDPDVHSLISNNVVRVGVTEHFEVSSLFNIQRDQYSHQADSLNFDQHGLSSLQLGFRYNILDKANGLIPAIGIQTRFRLPVNSPAYTIDNAAPVIILITSHALPKGFGLATNWVYSLDGNTPEAFCRYIANLSFLLGGRWSGFVENYGNLGVDFDTYVDGGIAYLVTNDLQLDLHGGLAGNDRIKERFISLGLSWRTRLN